MSKIYQDSHGLFVRGGGYLFRPEHPDDARVSTFSVGDTVTVYHHGGTPLGTVKTKEVKEEWYSHGSYTDGNGKRINSEDVFEPDYAFGPVEDRLSTIIAQLIENNKRRLTEN